MICNTVSLQQTLARQRTKWSLYQQCLEIQVTFVSALSARCMYLL